MTRLRGILDAPLLAALALLAIPWCLLAPASWEALLDRLARRALFKRTIPVPPDDPPAP